MRWSDFPIAPRRWPFFYGWVIVVAGIAGMYASIPGQTMGVGVFTDDLLAALNLTRTQLSTAYMLGTIGSALMLPFAGSFLDRVGTRLMFFISASGLALSVAGLSSTDRIAALLGADALISRMVPVFVCFMFMRFFGQGCLAMVSRVGIGKWFHHRRGLATAISGVFISIGFSVSPFVLDRLVREFGWRNACLVLAAVVGGGIGVLGWVFYRDTPERCGLVMDGVTDEAWHRRMAAKVPDIRREFTRAEAMRTIAFWAFNLGTASFAFVVTGITFNVSSMGSEMGLSRTQAYGMFLPMSLCGVTANFVAGWLSDRVRLKWLLVAMMITEAVGATGLFSFGEPVGWALLIVGYGFAGGFFGVLVTVAWPRFFGRTHLGAISGVHMSVMVLASAIAPVLFSVVHGWTGTYQLAIMVCWGVPIAVMIAAFAAENPQERCAESPRTGEPERGE